MRVRFIIALDVSDMWIQEGWATYLEVIYVERLFGADDALKYVNGLKEKVSNTEPIISQRGIHLMPPADQYFKGALFLHTLRSVVADEAKWWATLRDVYQKFKYQNIMTEELLAFMNARLGMNLTPMFDQYLRRAAIPTLELAFNEAEQTVTYRWRAEEREFAMPIRVGVSGTWQTIQPTTEWKVMANAVPPDQFQVATELFYVNVAKGRVGR